MADQDRKKIAASRQYYSASGRESRVKRKLSGDKEESSEKRDKLSTTDTSQTENPSSTSCPEIDKMASNTDLMIEEIVTRVTEAMKIQSEKSTNKILDELNGRMKRIEEKDVEQDEEIENLKRRMEEKDQKEMSNQMIVTGLRDGTNKPGVIELLNDKMQINLAKDDILYILKLGNKEQKSNRTRVVFKNSDIKDEVMKKRSKLKGTDLWLADALTPFRLNLAYLARQSLKGKKIEATWVYDGKIFMKRKGKDRPEIVKSSKDLPK